jgi:polyisoprenyl-teichoic acid--peptidoglycan teichoic acid transferase
MFEKQPYSHELNTPQSEAPFKGDKRRVMPRHTLPRRRRGTHWGRWVAGLLLFALVAILTYAVYIGISVAKISTQPLDFSGLSADASGRTNILVLGVGDPGHAGQNLSDTMMVLSIDAKNHRVAQISVPRDLRVDIPGYGTGKINAANADGGPELAEQTVSNALNIPINYYVLTNFSGLKQMVDAVGGLDINVKERLYDPEYPCADNENESCGIDIQPGLQHMDGTKALEYVRCRKGTCGNDFGRAERQQEVMNLLRQKAVRFDVLLNPSELTPVVSALRNGVKTDMGAVQLLQLANDWQNDQKNNPVKLVLSTSDGGYLLDAPGSSDLVPIGGDFSAIQDRVKNIFGNASNPDTP